jgi:hypothetical protein
MAVVVLTGEQLFALVADELEPEDERDLRAEYAQIKLILDLDDQLGLFEDAPVTGTEAL